MSQKREPRVDDETILRPTEEARRSFGEAFERLVGLMARLRGEEGCPWDREQDLESLKAYLIEEAYEVLEALEGGSVKDHEEELGDLLLQVVFQAEIRRQEGAFDAADVAHAIADKLVRRHPHVFGDVKAGDRDEAWARWEELKAAEKRDRSVLAGVPQQLPALLRAQRVAEKASRVGFDWKEVKGPLAKVKEEVAELEEALERGDSAEVLHELGDTLFSLVNVARFAHVNAEDALRATVARFQARFEHVEQQAKDQGRALRDMDLDEMDALWERAKASLQPSQKSS